MIIKGTVFRNSKRYINEGTGIGKGILYCGEKYTNNEGCPCGTCDGYCGIDNGCPCPDCEYTLSYLLYSSGKMKCGKCKKTLIRIIIFHLINIYKEKKKPIQTIMCNICKNCYNYYFIPIMHCLKCDYSMCPKCAFSKITPFVQEMPVLEEGFNLGYGMIYCKKNYVENGFCLDGGCDGNCGPENGCPCPLCDAILGYNMYLKRENMKCQKCENLLVKTTVGLLKKANARLSTCSKCNETFGDDGDFSVVYRCSKCRINVCKSCAYRTNIRNIKNIVSPNMPLFLDTIQNLMKDKVDKKKIEEYKICKQKRFNTLPKPEKANNIKIYLKTLVGRIYTINIDDTEDVAKLKEELRKHDKKFIDCNTILIYKNKKLDDFEYLKDLGISEESLINIITI